MPITAYQSIIKEFLSKKLAEGKSFTEEIVVMASEKEFIKDLCIDFGYVPVFSPTSSSADQEWVVVVCVKKIEPC